MSELLDTSADKPALIPGKWYRTHGGWRAWYIGKKADGSLAFEHEAALNSFYQWSHDDSGASLNSALTNHTITGPWIDKPVVDWSKERNWVKAIAMDSNQEWYRHSGVPKQFDCYWHSGCWSQKMHPSEYPTNADGSPWTGDWKDSLIKREEGGAK